MKSISDIRIQLRDRFVRFYTDDLVRISRKRDMKRDILRKCTKSQPLTQLQQNEISTFWSNYRSVDKEMEWFSFYNVFCSEKDQLKYYIPNSVYYAEIDASLSNPRRSMNLDDKNLYDLYFHDVRMPRTIIRKVDGEFLDEVYRAITLDEAVERCVEAGQIVFKEAICSHGGHGVIFFDFSADSVDKFRNLLVSGKSKNIIVQDVVRQHKCLNSIYDKSINTVRIMTLFLDGETHVLSTVLRMGRDGSRVDNASSGGIVCGVDEKGALKEFAFDTKGNRWDRHPQGTVFKGTQIEGINRCHDLVNSLAGRLCTTSRMISWDLAIGEDGEPVLIEMNLTFGQVDFHQMCNGPIFGDMTEAMLERVYHRKG